MNVLRLMDCNKSWENIYMQRFCVGEVVHVKGFSAYNFPKIYTDRIGKIVKKRE